MTALATTNDRAPTTPKPPIATGGALAALIPQDMEQAFRLANALAASGDMVPKPYQGNAPACMAAIVRGLEIGLPPMQALASIAVINGRASLWGDALPALMMRAGHHIDVEYEGAGDALTAVATLTRGDTGKTIVRRFSMADAKRAGLIGKQGPWQAYPQRMIAMRARAWAIRDGAADALMGLSIADEAADAGPDTARDVTPVTTPRRGGAIYRDPDPVDEIVEAVIDAETGEVAPPPASLPPEIESIVSRIEGDLADVTGQPADVVADAVGMWRDQIDRLSADHPAAAERLAAAVKGAQA